MSGCRSKRWRCSKPASSSRQLGALAGLIPFILATTADAMLLSNERASSGGVSVKPHHHGLFHEVSQPTEIATKRHFRVRLEFNGWQRHPFCRRFCQFNCSCFNSSSESICEQETWSRSRVKGISDMSNRIAEASH